MKNRLVTIVCNNKKIETVMTYGSRSQCEDQAFEYADVKLNLASDEEKSNVELFFHEDARAQVLFSDIETYK